MAKRTVRNPWLERAAERKSRPQPRLESPLAHFKLEPEEQWYVTLFDPQGASIYGPFDTKSDAEKWLKKQGGKGHVWRRRACD